MTAPEEFALDAHELRCLGSSTTLPWLLLAEHELVACLESCPSGAIEVEFPVLPSLLSKALDSLCKRLGLTLLNDRFVKGTAKAPTLRYADYFPGGLSLAEILSVFNLSVPQASSLKERAPGVYSASFFKYEGCERIVSGTFASNIGENDLDPAQSAMLVDLGLPLPSHCHLAVLHPAQGCSWAMMMTSVHAMSEAGVNAGAALDIRRGKSDDAGVVVFSSIPDASEFFERYEDVDSDTDEKEGVDPSPYSSLVQARPVGSFVPVPCVEDHILKRCRGSHWTAAMSVAERRTIVASGHQATKYAALLTNLASSASIEELMAFFDPDTVAEAFLAVDAKSVFAAARRKLFVRFNNPVSLRTVLDLDGQKVGALSAKGQLKATAAPPYAERIGYGRVLEVWSRKEVATSTSASKKSTAPATAAKTSPPPADGSAGKPAAQAATSGGSATRARGNSGKRGSPPPEGAAAVASARGKDAGKVSPQAGPLATPAAVAVVESHSDKAASKPVAATTSTTSAPAPASTAGAAATTPGMSIDAKCFYPKTVSPPTGPLASPPLPPPFKPSGTYIDPMTGMPIGGPAPPPPPPSYGVAPMPPAYTRTPPLGPAMMSGYAPMPPPPGYAAAAGPSVPPPYGISPQMTGRMPPTYGGPLPPPPPSYAKAPTAAPTEPTS